MNTIYWIAEYAATFVEAITCFIFCGTFINREKIVTEKRLALSLSLIGSLFVIIFNTITLFSQTTVIFNTIIFWALQYIIYKRPVKVLIFTATFLVILSSVDFSIIYSIAYIAELPIADIVLRHDIARLITLFFTKSLLAIIIYAIYKLTVKNPVITKKHTITMLIFSISVFALIFFILFKDVHSDVEMITTLSALFSITVLILVLSLFFGTIKFLEHYENKQQSMLLALRNKMLEDSMLETEKTFFLWKTSLHDYKHNIFHLMTLAENNNMDEIKTFLNKENDLLVQKLFYYKTGNNTVDTIINVKQSLAHEKGISFLVNASIPSEHRVSDTHLCAVLGNLIDNAINASQDEQEPYIEVNIKQIKDFLIIKVVNRFTNTTPKLDKSKKEQAFHGIGLKSVKRIIKDYDGEFVITKENDLFIAEAIIQL